MTEPVRTQVVVLVVVVVVAVVVFVVVLWWWWMQGGGHLYLLQSIRLFPHHSSDLLCHRDTVLVLPL